MHSHLTKQTRIQLGILLRAGVSLRGAAKLFGVHHSSLSRELRRNKATGKQSQRTGYHARDAHLQAKARRHKDNQRFRKILPGSRLEALIVAKIAQCKWAPEMQFAEQIERATGTKVYLANPYHSWERGTNENTNVLLRYFFPKQSSFATLTQADIDQAVRLLNTRPRKRLNWRTPAQVFKV